MTVLLRNGVERVKTTLHGRQRGVSALYQVQSNSDSGIIGEETLTGKETVALASFIVCILHRIFLDVDWVCMLLF